MEENIDERRQYQRIHKHDRVEVFCPGSTGLRFSAQIMNKSAGGLRFYAADEIVAGEVIETTVDGQMHKGAVLECAPCFSGYAVRVRYE